MQPVRIKQDRSRRSGHAHSQNIQDQPTKHRTALQYVQVQAYGAWLSVYPQTLRAAEAEADTEARQQIRTLRTALQMIEGVSQWLRRNGHEFEY